MMMAPAASAVEQGADDPSARTDLATECGWLLRRTRAIMVCGPARRLDVARKEKACA
jgi:hypothetical protein